MNRRAAVIAAALAIAIGSVYVLAWSTGAAVAWVAAGQVVVKANMALCHLLGGLALFLLVTAPRSAVGRPAAMVLALLVSSIGGLVLAEHLLRRDLGIDQLLIAAAVPESVPLTAVRVGPFAALALVSLGAALLALAWRRPRLAQGLAVAAVAVVVVPIIGILYGIELFQDIAGANQIVWPGAIGILAIAAGIALARPDTGMMVLLIADDPGGRLLRRLLLPAMLVPMLAGWVRTLAARRGVVDAPTGTGLLIAALILFIVAMLWRAARQVSDWARRQREMALRFELLAETAQALLSSREPQAAGDALGRRVLPQLDCECYLNYLVDEPSGQLRLNAWAGISAAEAQQLGTIGLGDGVCGSVAKRGERLVVAEVGASDDPRLGPLRDLGLRAYACHPLLAPDGKTIGTLSFGSRTRDAFSAEDLPLMHAVADQLATAVWRIRIEQQIHEQERHFRETLEQRVVQRTAELQRLTLELTRVEQRERNRLAELLHDGLQQFLVAAKLHVGLVMGAADGAQREERARDLVELLHESLATTRTLTVELSPPALRDLGLVPALHWLADWVQTRHHLRVRVTAEAPTEPRDPTVRTLLYQCVRELLLNVVKYAGVEEATVQLAVKDAGTFSLVVRDGGQGFDPALVCAHNPESFGLASIHRRIELVGGRVQLDSVPGRGTEVRIEVPLGAPTAIVGEGTA